MREHDPTTLLFQGVLGVLHVRMGKIAAARSIQEEVLQTLHATLPEDPTTITCMQNLGAALVHIGDTHGGVLLLEEAVATARQVLGPVHPVTQAATRSQNETLRARNHLVEPPSCMAEGCSSGWPAWPELNHGVVYIIGAAKGSTKSSLQRRTRTTRRGRWVSSRPISCQCSVRRGLWRGLRNGMGADLTGSALQKTASRSSTALRLLLQAPPPPPPPPPLPPPPPPCCARPAGCSSTTDSSRQHAGFTFGVPFLPLISSAYLGEGRHCQVLSSGAAIRLEPHCTMRRVKGKTEEPESEGGAPPAALVEQLNQPSPPACCRRRSSSSRTGCPRRGAAASAAALGEPMHQSRQQAHQCMAAAAG